MLETEAPPRIDVVEQAASIAPLLATHGAWTDGNRRLHEDVIAAMAGAGLFRMRVPHRYGGLQSDARTVNDAIATVAAADGSAAWTLAVYSISAWIASLFPDEVQDEVFATPDVRVCGVLSPTAMAEPAPGGFTVSGRWHFISGALHSQWQAILAMGPAPDGSLWPLMMMVPMSDLAVIDDWNTSGLRGTGSVSTAADKLFVPAARVLPMVAILQEQYASQRNAGSGLYRQPLMPMGCTTFTGAALGLARAAVTGFAGQLDRKITYTEYASQREAALTHLQMAEASLLTDEAEFHADKLAGLVDAKSGSGAAWTLPERIAARAELGRVFHLAKQAIGIVANASGGSSIYDSAVIQRIDRDVRALNMHALMHPDTNFELYGRILCGLGPNTMYV